MDLTTYVNTSEKSPAKRNLNKVYNACKKFGKKPRLLNKRYLLTTTGYKILEIGVKYDTNTLDVQIILALIDNWGNELEFSIDTYLKLVDIEKQITSSPTNIESRKHNANLTNIGEMNLKFYKLSNVLYVDMQLQSSPNSKVFCMMMHTFSNLMKLKDCVMIMHNAFNQILSEIRVKFVMLMKLAAAKDDKDNVIEEYKKNTNYDKVSLIDNELIAFYSLNLF